LDSHFLLRHIHLPHIQNRPAPYIDLSSVRESPTDVGSRPPPVFITSRFRSGSTLLWNLFRQIKGCTAYYEPFNERQWFNPTLRGVRVDDSHVGVSDYWREYEGLEELAQWYQPRWIDESLYMTERSWDPAMVRYIELLVERASNRAVLQFNRVDFRLAWLRHYFPQAVIVHLYRHPREQWLSFLRDKREMNALDVDRTYRDSFYLDSWCADLRCQFPFLERDATPHPYRRFYYLWKLSFLHGQHYAHTSLSFEELVSTPEDTMTRLLHDVDWTTAVDVPALSALVEAPRLDRWRDYADAGWFAAHEEACEAVLAYHLDSASAAQSARPPGG
jgi:hypothetical protein